jgi:16S rRNA processing protein RimM
VKEVERIAITDYLSVKTDDALVNAGESKSFLVPYQKPFILSTDVDAKRINVIGAIDLLQSS